MKMLKKIMAVVLTGALAASMLTGCALSDKIAANALEDALNTKGTQGDELTIDYNQSTITTRVAWMKRLRRFGRMARPMNLLVWTRLLPNP